MGVDVPQEEREPVLFLVGVEEVGVEKGVGVEDRQEAGMEPLLLFLVGVEVGVEEPQK